MIRVLKLGPCRLQLTKSLAASLQSSVEVGTNNSTLLTKYYHSEDWVHEPLHTATDLGDNGEIAGHDLCTLTSSTRNVERPCRVPLARDRWRNLAKYFTLRWTGGYYRV